MSLPCFPFLLHCTGRASWRLQKAHPTRHIIYGVLSHPLRSILSEFMGALSFQPEITSILARQLGVAERGDMSYTGARDYTIGIAKDKEGNVECDPTFYLIATSGLYRGEIPLILQDDLSTNWIGYIAIGPYVDNVAKRDIVVAFRGTQVLKAH